MMVDQRILEALDSCRPGSNDLARAELAEAALEVQRQPQLRELTQRLDRFDREVQAAMDDVAVPQGLANRLLAAVTAAENVEPIDDALNNGDAQTAELVERPSSNIGRRWAIGVGLAVAASAVIAVTALWLQQTPQQITFDLLEREVGDWRELAWADNQWNTSIAAAPAGYPMAPPVLAIPRRWRNVQTSVDSRAVAYDLTPPGSRNRATLFVARSRTMITSLTPFPPVDPQSTTGGRAIAAWQDESGLLYVLVVEGPRRRYNDLVDTRTGPLI